MTGAAGAGLSSEPDPDVSSCVSWSRERRRWETASAEPRPAAAELERGRAVVICTYERPASLIRCLESLREQLGASDELVVVDASAGAASEDAIRGSDIAPSMVASFRYFRVTGRYRGLTRQKNFALARVTRDLVAFFDDDIVLLPDCLNELERVHRELKDEVAGVAALIQGARTTPNVYWRLRRRLGAVSELRPGAYSRSGFSIPWEFLRGDEDLVDGDYLPGGTTMWRTRLARRVGFYEGFDGYAKGEDVEFSLRARTGGRLVMACRARLLHLHEPTGRPDGSKMGYMAIRNRYLILRRRPDQTLLDTLWLAYGCALDTAFVAANFRLPSRWAWTVGQLMGRGRAVLDLLRGR